MRRLMFIVLLAGAGIPTGYAQETVDSEAGSKLVALENLWNQAAQSKDLKALGDILDDAFVYVDRDGSLRNKAEVLADVQASHGVEVFSGAMSVHLHGLTAIVTGIYRTKGTDRGKPFVREDRFLDTWRYKNGTWIAIASLATPIGS